MASSTEISIGFVGEDKSASKTSEKVSKKIADDFNGVKKDVDGFGKTTDDTTNKSRGRFSRLAGSIGGFAVAAGAGLAAVGGAAIVGGKYMLDYGSKLEQMGAKADTVFGGQVGKVKAWAEESAGAMGLTSMEATGLAANFGDLLIPMGFSRQQAAKMSTDVVGLSGALSQWSGGTVSAAETSQILADAMLGETDGLKALGISISAAEIDAQLLKKGQQDLTGSALAQAQAQATQALIFQKSTDAQKAFAAGGSPLLTAQNKLKAAFGEVRDKVALALVPAFTKVLQFLVKLGPVFSRVGKAIGGGGGGGAIGEAFNNIKRVAATAFASLRRGVAFLASTFGPGMKAMAGIIKNQVVPVIRGMARFTATQLLPAIIKVAAKIGTAFKPVLVELARVFRSVILPALKKALIKLEEWRPTIQRVLLWVVKITGKVLVFAAVILGKVLPPLIKFAGFLIGRVIGAISKVIGAIGAIVRAFINLGRGVIAAGAMFGRFVSAIGSALSRGLGQVRNFLGAFMSAFSGLGSRLYSIGVNMMQGFLNGITAMAGRIYDYVSNFASGIADKFANVLQIFSPSRVFKSHGLNIMRGLLVGMTKGQREVSKVMDRVGALIKKKMATIASIVKARNDFAAGFQGFTSSVFGADMTDPETGQSLASPANMIQWQRAEQDKARQLAKSVRLLRDKGLSPSLLRELQASGDSGRDKINSLSGASKYEIGLLNAAQNQTKSYLSQAGMIAGNGIYGSSIRSEQRELKAARMVAKVVRNHLDQRDQNTQVILSLDGRRLQVSLLELKRKSGRKLGLG